MEFKVPRSQWDQYWEDQQKLRRSLVKQLKSKNTPLTGGTNTNMALWWNLGRHD